LIRNRTYDTFLSVYFPSNLFRFFLSPDRLSDPLVRSFIQYTLLYNTPSPRRRAKGSRDESIARLHPAELKRHRASGNPLTFNSQLPVPAPIAGPCPSLEPRGCRFRSAQQGPVTLAAAADKKTSSTMETLRRGSRVPASPDPLTVLQRSGFRLKAWKPGASAKLATFSIWAAPLQRTIGTSTYSFQHIFLLSKRLRRSTC